jgi:hypothetical protein
MINPLIKHINHPIDPSHPPAPADIAVVLIASESLRGHIPREAAEMAPWRHRWHCADRHRPPRKTRDDFTEKETTLVSYYKSIVDDVNRHMFDLSICVHKTKTHTHTYSICFETNHGNTMLKQKNILGCYTRWVPPGWRNPICPGDAGIHESGNVPQVTQVTPKYQANRSVRNI